MRLRITCGLVAATLMLAAATSAEANTPKDPSAHHAQPPTITAAAPQAQFAVTMANQPEVSLSKMDNALSARFERTAGIKATNDAIRIKSRGEDPPEATASTSLALLNEPQYNGSFANFTINHAGTNTTDIIDKIPRAFAAANNSSKTDTVLRL